jgi:hypothetical protein
MHLSVCLSNGLKLTYTQSQLTIYGANSASVTLLKSASPII